MTLDNIDILLVLLISVAVVVAIFRLKQLRLEPTGGRFAETRDFLIPRGFALEEGSSSSGWALLKTVSDVNWCVRGGQRGRPGLATILMLEAAIACDPSLVVCPIGYAGVGDLVTSQSKKVLFPVGRMILDDSLLAAAAKDCTALRAGFSG